MQDVETLDVGAQFFAEVFCEGICEANVFQVSSDDASVELGHAEEVVRSQEVAGKERKAGHQEQARVC